MEFLGIEDPDEAESTGFNIEGEGLFYATFHNEADARRVASSQARGYHVRPFGVHVRRSDPKTRIVHHKDWKKTEGFSVWR
ncbi:MAG: hypothetical protein KGN01_01510 [Patescibacteria group bacterium]|nr:hypothetical protein [Patescibacteria group bacterium]